MDDEDLLDTNKVENVTEQNKEKKKLKINEEKTVDPKAKKKKVQNEQNKKEEKLKIDEEITDDPKAKLFEKVLSTKEKHNMGEYEEIDRRVIEVSQKIDEKIKKAPKTIREEADNEKMGIERRLEDSDKQLSELIQLGNELVTNIRVANEKREITRRNYEAIKRDELLDGMENEQFNAVMKYNSIISKWAELKTMKEPMGLYEQMEEQKKKISDLLQQKDNFIKECHEEQKRVDEKYYEDLEKQSADIYCLVERIDNQLELMKGAYKDHLELLQKTIAQERENLSKTAEKKFEEIFSRRTEDEKRKTDIEKEKSQLYAEEIERIALEHEEITRATKILLEKRAEQLQLELQTVKHNVLLNSEKLDYNYQVLQKREDENVIIRNQQKRRLGKINETILALKKKIANIKETSSGELKKLSKEGLKLQSSITEMQMKAKNFAAMHDKKYQTVWNINYQEVLTLVNKILDIDKIFYEQQLGLHWSRPKVPAIKMKDLSSYKAVMKELQKDIIPTNLMATTDRASIRISKVQSQIDTITPEKTLLPDTKLLRTIIYKISDKAAFLLEDKLINILEPYTDVEKNLVKIDNIFKALNVTKIEDVNALTEYFLPYTWCPNCSSGISPETISKLYQVVEGSLMDQINHESSSSSTRIPYADSKIKDEPNSEQSITESEDICYSSESDHNVDMLLGASLINGDKKSRIDFKKSKMSINTYNQECENHYLVVEPVLVLTALREYAEHHFGKRMLTPQEIAAGKTDPTEQITIARAMTKEDVVKFWSQFREIISEQKQKIWKSLEHGLNHFLDVLKERETLDSQCEFLRRQNAELKHLLQKYIPDECKEKL